MGLNTKANEGSSPSSAFLGSLLTLEGVDGPTFLDLLCGRLVTSSDNINHYYTNTDGTLRSSMLGVVIISICRYVLRGGQYIVEASLPLSQWSDHGINND